MGKKIVWFLLILMVAVAGAALMSTAHAETMMTRIGGLSIRLIGNPCTAPSVLQHIREDARPKWKAGTAAMGEATLQLCWAAAPDGMLLILNEAGAVDIAPTNVFTLAPEA